MSSTGPNRFRAAQWRVFLSVVTTLIAAQTLAALPLETEQTECLSARTQWPYGEATSLVADDSSVIFSIDDHLLLGRHTTADDITVLKILEFPSIKGIIKSGSLVAVRSRAGIHLVDVSDFENPATISVFVNSSEIKDMVFAEQTIVIASEDGAQIIDVADPANPTEIGSWDKNHGYWRIAVSGSFVYAVSLGDGLDIVDVSDPENTQLVGHLDQFNDQEYMTEIVVEDGYAFIASSGGTNGLGIVDVSDPANPNLIATYVPDADPFNAIGLHRNHLFLSESYFGGVDVVDVSDPQNPEEIQHIGALEDVHAFGFSDNLVYMASGFGVEAMLWDPQTWPTDAGSYASSGEANRTAFGDDFVAVGANTFRLIESGEGGAHREVGRIRESELEIGGVTRDLVLKGNTAYWLRHDNLNRASLYLVEFGIPEHPFVATYKRGDFRRVALGNDHVFLIGSDLMTVAETRLLEIGSLGLAGTAKAIAVQGSYAYILVEGRGLVVSDVSEPWAPTIAASLPLNGSGTQVVINWNTAFVAGFENGLRAIDISDPEAPEEIGLFQTPQSALDLKIVGTCAFVLYPDEVKVVDVTDPANMTETASLATSGSNLSIAVNDGTISIAQGQDGVALIEIGECGCEEAATQIFIPAAATGPGFGTSIWSTEVVLNNPGLTSLSYEVRFMPRGQDNSTRPADAVFSLEPGRSAAYPDIVNELLGVSSASGAIRFDILGGGHLLANSRTMSTGDDEQTYGQGIPVIRKEQLIGPRERVRLLQLSENQAFRTNIGFMSASTHTLTVKVDFFSSDGRLLGTDSFDLKPYVFEQWNRAFARIGEGDLSNAYADVWSETEGASFFTYASVVDEQTNDPTYIQPEAVPASGRRGPAAAR